MSRTRISGREVADKSLDGRDIETFFKYAESEGLSETTSTDWIDKLTLVTDDITAGTFKLSWCYSWFYSNIANDFQGRIIINNDTDNPVMLHIEEPQESSSDQRHWCSGFRCFDIEAGVYTIKLQFRSSKENFKAGIINAHLEFKQVERNDIENI